ncbi:MAG: ABC transporter ATP-binding protein [Firmicutes bacterium]|nr:ABC transporter ATP-binding protein [Bacillota bacterium]
MLLEAKRIVKRFGGLVANDGVDLSVDEGEIIGLIGPNGAGKTTLFNCITGFLRPEAGTIVFDGTDITGWPPHRVTRRGIARTFQLVRNMDGLTIEENVMIGALARTNHPDEARRVARSVLELVGLDRAAHRYPGEMPLAVQKQMELARALATRPRLVMLDEVASGLSPEEMEEFAELVRRIHQERRVAFVVIEHVMEFVLPLSHRVLVLSGGKPIAEGTPEEVTRNPAVIEAYLGESHAASR